MDGGVLGQDRDAALALELVAVHRALGDALVGAERAALVQQRVDQRRLAVVDVRDDGDVAAKRVGDVRACRAVKKAFLLTKTSSQYTGRRPRRRLGQLRLLARRGEDFLRAIAELLVVGDFLRELPRFVLPRQVEVRHRRVEPRGRRSCDGRRRSAARAWRSDAPGASGGSLTTRGSRRSRRARPLGALEARRGVRQHARRRAPTRAARPARRRGRSDLAVAAVALARQLELRARDVELLPAVGDEAGELGHLGVDQQLVRQLDVGPRLVVARELRSRSARASSARRRDASAGRAADRPPRSPRPADRGT